MVINNCITCMYSEYSKSSLYITDLIQNESDYCICNHINSAYYDELVNDDTTCRLFLDSNLYFKRKDRKDKLDNIKNKNR